MNDTALMINWIDRRDVDAFSQIVSRHGSLVYGTCQRVLGNAAEAEDAVQDCFLELARVRHPPRRSLAGWLHTVATNKSRNRLKSRARRRRREERYAREALAARERDDPRKREEVSYQLDEAIERLPPRLREVIVACFLEQRSQTEAARLLGVSRQTIGYRVRSGIARIRRELARKGLAVPAASIGAWLADVPRQPLPPALASELGHIALSSTRCSGSITTGRRTRAGLASLTTARSGPSPLYVSAGVATFLTGLGVLLWLQGAPPETTKAPPRPPPHVATGAGDPEAVVRDAKTVTAAAVGAGAERTAPAVANDGISGRVVDLNGKGVAGAEVVLVGGRDAVFERIASDDAGHFAFGRSLPGEELGVYAFRHGTGLGHLRLIDTSTPPLEIVLEPFLAEVRGRVVSRETGVGIAHLGLSAVDYGRGAERPLRLAWDVLETLPRVTRSLRTDEHGRFQLIDIPPSRYQLRLERSGADHVLPGYSGPPLEVLLAPGEAREGLDVALPLGAAVAGTVSDSGGALVPDAAIQLVPAGHASFVHDTNCDASGRYRIGGLAPGEEYRVLSVAPGFAPGASGKIVADAGETINADIALQPGATLRGRLVDERGESVGGCRVWLSRTYSGFATPFGWASSRSGEDGRFVFPHVTTGPLTLRVDVDDRTLRHELDLSEAEFGREQVIVVESEAPGLIHGRVVDADGQPVNEARVFLIAWGDPRDGRSVASGRDGRFACRGVEPDRDYSLYARHRLAGGGERHRLRSSTKEVTLQLEPGGEILGTVRDARSGAPLCDFEVTHHVQEIGDGTGLHRASPWRAVHNDNGAFGLEEILSPQVRVAVRATGYAPAWSRPLDTVPGGRVEGIEVALHPATTLSGSVVDASTGAPIAAARVVAELASAMDALVWNSMPDGHGETSWETISGDDGSFELAGLPVATSVLLFAGAEGRAVGGRALTIAPGERHAARLRLESQATLEIELRGTSPTTEVSVDARPVSSLPESRLRFTATASASGRISLDQLPAARYELLIRSRESGLGDEARGDDASGPCGKARNTIGRSYVEVPPGESREIIVDLTEVARREARIEGTVTGSEPLDHIIVSVHPIAAPHAAGRPLEQCWSTPRGHFSFDGLAGGQFIVRARRRRAVETTEVSIRLRPGETADVRLDLP